MLRPFLSLVAILSLSVQGEAPGDARTRHPVRHHARHPAPARHPVRKPVPAAKPMPVLLPAAAAAAATAPKPVLPVEGAAMVAAADPRGAAAGRAMLAQGGSAADAAMAMMVALTVVEPQSSGIGGGGYFVYHDARSGEIGTVDGRETAPAGATPNRFQRPDGTPMPFSEAVPGGLSVGVPGNLRLMERVHQRWGKLPWAALFKPAIALAEDGFAVTPRLAAALADKQAVWADFPAARAIYWKDGRPARVGETIRNPALAAFLRELAADGADAFYSGLNAAAVTGAIASSTRNPATMTAADLTGYRAKPKPATCGRYRVYRVCGMGPSSAGTITILSILGMLERFDIDRLGPDNPVSWHLIGEAMRLAYADRDLYLGDTDFVKAPVAGLIDRDYLAKRSQLIRPDRTLGVYEAGTPPGAEPRGAAKPGEVSGTTNFVAADRAGDVATMTSTVESGFGSSLVVNGYVLNNELTDFSFADVKGGAPVANRVEPGKRPLSSMSPVIVYDAKGRVVLAIGSAGGRQIPMHVLRGLIGVLDWKLPAQAAIALPNIFFTADGGLLVERGTALDAMRPALARMGENVVAADITSKLTAVERIGTQWRGAADPRSEGVALAQ